MRIKFLIPILLLFISCAPSYIPKTTELGTNVYGGKTTLKLTGGDKKVQGELIAINFDDVIILLDKKGKLEKVPYYRVVDFKLTFATSKTQLYWTIPIYTIISMMSHGLYFAYTAPINMILTSIIAIEQASIKAYSKKDLSLEELRMFARFPQGMPAHFEENLPINQYK